MQTVRLVYVRKSVEESTAREVIESLLHGALELLTNPRNPRGCLSVQGALANGTGGETVKQALIDWRKRGEALLEERFRRAQKEGDLKDPSIQVILLAMSRRWSQDLAFKQRMAPVGNRCLTSSISL